MDEIDTRLEVVMRDWPNLTYQGFFTPDLQEPLASVRAKMLEPDAVAQFHLCCDYISHNIGFPAKAGKAVSSYYLKHSVEHWYSAQGNPAYVSNGMFIAAMISNGHAPAKVTGPNCNFKLSSDTWARVSKAREKAGAI